MPKIYDIPLIEIDDFPNHPFKVKHDEDMDQLVESVKERGIITPITLRQKEDGRYEIVSGHRRRKACELAGLETVRAEIKELSRDEAIILMVESNLQRSTILPSEKAFAYKLKLDAMSKQGFRSDLTSDQVGRKLKTVDIIAEQVDESKTQIRRYIRLTYLIPELLDLMDEGKIAFSVGVELSYLDDQLQYDLLNEIEANDSTPSYAQSVHMHKAYRDGMLDKYAIQDIMSEIKANQKEKVSFQIDDIRRYFPKSYTTQDIQSTIMQLIQKEYERKQCPRDAR